MTKRCGGKWGNLVRLLVSGLPVGGSRSTGFTRLPVLVLLALALGGAPSARAQAEPRDDQVIHDVGDAEIHTVANRLGLRYEELGMGNNRLGRGRFAFDVSVPDAGHEGGTLTTAQRREQTLDLGYYSSRTKFPAAAIRAWNTGWPGRFSTASAERDVASLHARLFLVDGVTFRTVLEHVRRFDREIRAFEAALRKPIAVR